MLRMFVYVFCAGVLLRALTIRPNVRLRLRGERAWLVYVCARTCVPHTHVCVYLRDAV